MPSKQGTRTKKLGLLCCVLLLIAAAIQIVRLLSDTAPPHLHDFVFEGDGSMESPYRIGSVEELVKFRDAVNEGETFEGCYFLQTADLDLCNIENWIPIGLYGAEDVFRGVYDGNGHTVKNLRLIRPRENVGFFGLLGGEVRNFGIESGYIEGACVGAIASHGNKSARIVNCFNDAEVRGKFRCGGIADHFPGEILFSWNLGNITPEEGGVGGGLVSYTAGYIRDCYSLQSPALTAFFNGKQENVKSPEDGVSPKEMNRLMEHAKAAWAQESAAQADSGKAEESIDTKLCVLTLTEHGAKCKLAFQPGSEPVEPTFDGTALLSEYWLAAGLGAAAILCAFFFLIWRIANRGRIQRHEEAAAPPEPPKETERINWAAITLVSILTVTLFLFANWILKQKGDDGITVMENYYLQPKDTVDVLIMGSSQGGVNFDNEVLWRDFGISAYSLWGSAQPFWSSYYYLREALQYGAPKVIVLEVRASTYDRVYSDAPRQYANTFGMRLSKNKIEAIQAAAPQEQWLNLLLGFPVYHGRYAELTREDFERFPWSENGIMDKGSSLRYGVGQKNREESRADFQTFAHMTRHKEEFYFRRFIETCKESGIPLLLVAAPYWDKDQVQTHLNFVESIAEEYDVPFLNMNYLEPLSRITAEDYWVDNRHLNTNGSRKATALLGKYLSYHYELPDHHGDDLYESWERFSRRFENRYYPNITELDDYLGELDRNDRTLVFLKWRIPDGDEAFSGFVEKMGEYRLDTLLSEKSDLCIYIESSYKPKDTQAQGLCGVTELKLDGKTLRIDTEKSGKVMFDGRELCSLEGGITAVIYDKDEKTIVDVARLFSPDAARTKNTVTHEGDFAILTSLEE